MSQEIPSYLHVIPADEHGHVDSMDCFCEPVLDEEFKLIFHPDKTDRQLNEPGHQITIDGKTAEYVVLFAYWLHGITRSKAIELLRLSPQGFEVRLEKFLKMLPEEYKRAEEMLRPSAL